VGIKDIYVDDSEIYIISFEKYNYYRNTQSFLETKGVEMQILHTENGVIRYGMSIFPEMANSDLIIFRV
jgi:hypothetical protein